MADRDDTGDRRPGPPRQSAAARDRSAPPGEPTAAAFEASASDEGPAQPDLAERTETTGRDMAPADVRPLTFDETLDALRLWYARIRGSRIERALASLILLVAGALAWLVISLVVPWSGGIAGSVAGVLALNLPWTPLPGPDDPAVLRDTGLATAAWVGAPLVIGAFWFVAAYHLDRASRRTYRVSEIPGVRHSTGYAAMAIVGVFPLIIAGLISTAWGVFALVSWAAAAQAWGSVVGLLALLLAFAAAVRVANGILDHRANARGAGEY